MSQASKIVSAAALGLDYKAVLVAGHRYIINPPTIKRLIGAAHYLAGVEDVKDPDAIVRNENALAALPVALSYFIKGDESLADDLAHGTPEELTAAITAAYSLISTVPFSMLSLLSKNVAETTAKQRP